MRRAHLLVFIFLFNLFHLSYSFESHALLCRKLFLDEYSSVEEYVKGQIETLEGEENFSNRYQSAYGLLKLAQELSNVTDKIDLILKVVSDVLEGDSFIDLNWSRAFGGKRDELIELIGGFLNKEGELRKRGNEYIFVFPEGESFSISGEGGFIRFAEEVFFGNQNQAFSAFVTVLNSSHLEELNWKIMLNSPFLKEGRLLEEIKRLNSNTGQSHRNAGELVEHLVTNQLLEKFFVHEKEIITSELKVQRNKKYDFNSSFLTPEERSQYKTDDRKKVVREIDMLMRSEETLIIVETKLTLTSKHVEDLIKTLKVRKFLFPKFDKKKFLGALAFYKVKEEGALELADKKGLYLLRIIDPRASELEQMNSQTFKENPF